MKNKFLVLIGMLVIALMMISCSNQQTSRTETDSETTEDKVMPETAQNEESAFANLLKMKQNLKYMVEWDINTQMQGQTTNTKMTQYFKDAKNVRTDMSAQGMEVRSYLVNEVMTNCFNIAGKWDCQKIDYQPSTNDQAESNIITGKVDYQVTKLPSKTIAGTSAQCYQAEIEKAKVTYCFSSEGIPLYMKTEVVEIITEITATKYSTTVADSVFELPK